MLLRQIDAQSPILKEKPYYNYFHHTDYQQDLRKCDNCFEGQNNDELLYCETCNSFIHRACYSLSDDQYEMVNQQETEDQLNFTFITCESCKQRKQNKSINIECFICRRNVGIMKQFLFDQRRVVYSTSKMNKNDDVLYEYYDTKNQVQLPTANEIKMNNIRTVFAHTLCVNSCSFLFIYMFKLLLIWDEDDYLNKKSISQINKCSFCNKGSGILIQCEHENQKFQTCKQYFHPFCAAEKQMIYYHSGMRLIHSNENVKYNQLDIPEAEDSQTYYYVIYIFIKDEFRFFQQQRGHLLNTENDSKQREEEF